MPVASYRLFIRKLSMVMRRPPAHIGVTFVTDQQIRRLNRRYRRKDRATDVLAFPQSHGRALGDIVISVPTARRQATGPKMIDLHRECRRLLIHGYLHLLGYDHERSTRDARRMHRVEQRLARQLV